MVWRKWLIRGLVVCVLGALAAGGGLYALWTNPAMIRQLVQEKLGVRFVRVAVQIGSARLRLLGGIQVSELRLARSDGVGNGDFLYVPSGVIYHDKEQMLDGKVAIRQVELHQPQLRIVRERDGRVNLAGILGPINLKERLPTVVIRDGTVIFEDRTLRDPSPLIEIRHVAITIINDPLPTLRLEGVGQAELLGPVRFKATVARATMATAVALELPTIPVGGDLLDRVSRLVPALAGRHGQLNGLASISGQVSHPGEAGGPIGHDLTLRLRNGRLRHEWLPGTVEGIDLTVRLNDGKIPEARLTAASGPARLEARLEGVTLAAVPPDLEAVESLVAAADLRVVKYPVSDDALGYLPADLQFVRAEFAPAGPLNVSYRYRRATAGQPLIREWTFQAEGMTGLFVDFPYPVRNVRGTMTVDTSASPLRNIHLDLTGLAGEAPVSLRGHLRGEKKTAEVHLDIHVREVLLDQHVYQALPPRVQRAARQFLPQPSRVRGLAASPMGRADVEATIRRARGQTVLDKQFTVQFKGASVLYDQFPYPLENVSGVLVVHPDRWECKGFRGYHGGGEIVVDAQSVRLGGERLAPGGTDPSPAERVRVRISGRDIPLDREFEKALAPTSGGERLALQTAWKRLRLGGRFHFSAEVVDDPGQPQDIDVSVAVRGCTLKPEFFDFALEDVSALVRYKQDQVIIGELVARHGAAELALRSGVIQIRAEGGYTAWLQGLTARRLTADADLRQALPEPLQRVVEAIRPRSPLDVAATLTIVSPPAGTGTRPPEVWWEGALGLHDAAFRVGVEVQQASGRLFTRGYHDGRRLRGVTGQLHLDRASILGQPMTKIQARLDAEPGTPEVFRFRDLKAELFGGTIAGQARVETAPLRYDLLLEAIGVQLDILGKHNLGESARDAQLQGPARAALHLVGEGTDLHGMKGNGRVDVPRGKMGQLPILLDLLKAFGLRLPDRTAFEQAHMVFAVEGPRLTVQQLDLYGNAISLRGLGSLDLDGSNVNLDFNATMGRLTQILPAGFDLIPQAISQQFIKIKMRGKLGGGGQIRFDKELIPAVAGPLRRAIGGE